MAAPTPTWPGSPRPRSPRSPTTIALDRRTAGGDPLNLPAQLTRLFGREAESAQLEDVLARTRLVTLTGAPGCGKSRLSLELGSRLTSRFRDGVWLTELAPLADPALTAGAVGMALGVGEQPGGPMAATLADALAGRELLLILDNCEQVVEAVAELAGHLIGRCPSVRILATSRVPLGLPGEQVWTLPPLTPEPAVELFIDRARLVSREFPVDDAGRSAIEQICRRLDGLPLAIELAAASTRVLSAGQVADRLEQELDLPGRGAPTASPWRRTMEATVDWSCRLLPDSDQRLFERLSVFAGGFDLPAVEAVAGDGGDVLVGLTTLVDHSLVLARPASGEPMRYRLLEPVRQSGQARLDARGETGAIRGRHAEHYLAVARQADLELRGDRRAPAFRRLEQEEGNLLQALKWAREQRSDLGLRLAAVLAQFWELRGRVNEGRGWLEEMLGRGGTDRQLRATALARAGRLAWRQRDHERARALIEESLGIKRALGDQLGQARRLRSLALVVSSEGDADAATRLCEQSAAIFRANGDDRGLVWALIFLGIARYTADDLAGGDAHIRHALSVNRGVGSMAATAYASLYLSHAAGMAGDVSAQRAHLTGAVAALRGMGAWSRSPTGSGPAHRWPPPRAGSARRCAWRGAPRR